MRTIRKISKGLEEKIIDLYINDELSMVKVAKTLSESGFKISAATVKNVLDRNNIKPRSKGGIYRPQLKDIYISYIEKNMTLDEVAKEYSISKGTVRNILIDNNIDRKIMGDYTNPNLVDCYFEEINTEAKAYLLGFLIADGNIYRRDSGKYVIRLDISEKDKDILSFFKEEVKSNNSFTKGHKGTLCFTINSEKMATDLAKYGMIENKTTRTYLPNIGDKLSAALIRGIFDGDGWATKFKGKGRKHFSYGWGICGSHLLMNEIRDFLVSELDVFCVTVHKVKNKNMSQITWRNKNDIRKICNWIYKDATIYLQRKKDIIVDLK